MSNARDPRAQVILASGVNLRTYLIYRLTIDGKSAGEIGRLLGMSRVKVGLKRKMIREFESKQLHRRRFAQREARARQRARAYGVTSEFVDFYDVFVAAKGCCHLCGEPVATDFDFDHVLALARGGGHVRQNIALAHAFCNRSKGSKLAPTQ